jgi:hypothetical protein
VSNTKVRSILKIAAILILVLFGIVVTHEIFSPYTAWYFVVPKTRLTVDGRPEQGRLHRGNHGETLFLTRREKGKEESYMIWIPRDRQGIVASCGHWTAPRFPVFPIGDVNPPCWTFFFSGGPTPKPTLPGRNLAAGIDFVEFTADDGRRLKISW